MSTRLIPESVTLTSLSAFPDTDVFADKPHRLNVRMRAAILCFDDLASGYRTRGWATRAAGYRAAISCLGTERTSWAGLSMSVDWSRPEVSGRRSKEKPIEKTSQGYARWHLGSGLS
jgi:hypothetical protein